MAETNRFLMIGGNRPKSFDNRSNGLRLRGAHPLVSWRYLSTQGPSHKRSHKQLVWGGELRDHTKNGCVGHYPSTRIRIFLNPQLFLRELPSVHAPPANPACESATFKIRSPVWTEDGRIHIFSNPMTLQTQIQSLTR